MTAAARSGRPPQPTLHLYGAPQLHAPGAPSFAPERRFQLLAVLAVQSGQWVPRDELAALLWPQRANADARRNLRHVVFKVRAMPGVEALEVSEQALRWPVATDLQRFEQALRDARPLDAVVCRRGRLLAGIDDPDNPALDEWLTAQRAQLDARWQQAAHAALAASATPEQRIDLAQRLLELDPLDETAISAQLEAELALGHANAAQRHYRDYALRLAGELGVEPSRRLRDLLAAHRPGTETAAAEPRAGFIGRRSELVELCALLAQPASRLVTLVGPGGIGKSRLAEQALGRLANSGTGRGLWIELQDLTDVAALTARLAQRLGASLADTRDPIAQIARRIGSDRLLCVLDNAEHLTGLPAWIERLLAAAPSLVLLVTSRTRLRSDAEQAFALAGLAVPDEDSRDLEAAGAFDAVRLFDSRARAAQRGFDLAQHLAAVIEIVERTDGMPLAIELAAAWVRLLPPEEIARELRESLDVLVRDPAAPGEPARPDHGSMQAVLERAWHMLAPAERDALAALSVFRGGFTRAAAVAVADAPLPLLSSLVDKSLLTVDERGRFGMHPLVAAEAALRLAADGEREHACRDRHSAFFADLLGSLAAGNGHDHTPLVDGIDAELANCTAAWFHAVAAGEVDQLMRGLEAWRVYFDLRGLPEPSAAQLRAALAMPPADGGAGDKLAAWLRALLARQLYRQGAFDDSLVVARAGARHAERAGASGALCGCLSHAGNALCALARWSEARPLYEQALTIARQDEQPGWIAAALVNLGIVARKEGRYQDALHCHLQALDTERELGNHMGVVRCLQNIGNVHMELDQWAAARPHMEQGLHLCERHQLGAMTPYLAFGLGAVLLELGDLQPAERHLTQAREHARQTENPVLAIMAEANLARVAARRGDFAAAGARLAATAGEASKREWHNQLLHQALFLGECCRLAGQAARAARLWQLVATHPLADAGLRDSALRWQAALALPADELAAAQREAPTLDATLECLLRGGDLADVAHTTVR
ncbi:MAG: tetratricopeptide repeat protein [Nitrospira sp.]|nr:tetratricopeptide repeat protein [Nitrospira sp.]